MQDAKFIFVNPEFSTITEDSESALLGTYPLEIVHPDFRQEVHANFIRALKRQRSFPYEFQIVYRNGKTKWIAKTATPVQFKERLAGLGYFMDIPGAKAEKEIVEMQKLQAILELAGAVGHELNNLLHVIMTCSERCGKNGASDPGVQELYKLMEKTSLCSGRRSPKSRTSPGTLLRITFREEKSLIWMSARSPRRRRSAEDRRRRRRNILVHFLRRFI